MINYLFKIPDNIFKHNKGIHLNLPLSYGFQHIFRTCVNRLSLFANVFRLSFYSGNSYYDMNDKKRIINHLTEKSCIYEVVYCIAICNLGVMQ